MLVSLLQRAMNEVGLKGSAFGSAFSGRALLDRRSAADAAHFYDKQPTGELSNEIGLLEEAGYQTQYRRLARRRRSRNDDNSKICFWWVSQYIAEVAVGCDQAHLFGLGIRRDVVVGGCSQSDITNVGGSVSCSQQGTSRSPWQAGVDQEMRHAFKRRAGGSCVGLPRRKQTQCRRECRRS